jgi:hypothetical protein
MFGYLLEPVIKFGNLEKKNLKNMAKLDPFFMQNLLFRSKFKNSSKKRLKCLPKKIIGLTCCKN